MDVRDGTHDTPKYVESGNPLITSKNLKNGEIDFTSIKLISKIDYDAINLRSKVDKGDILFAMIGSIGNPVRVTCEPNFAIKNMALFKPFDNQTNMEFILLFLTFAQTEMKNQASGGVQSFVSLNYLRDYLIPIPPQNEQIRILNCIKVINNKLNNFF